jgi:nicotinamidase-related amidase
VDRLRKYSRRFRCRVFTRFVNPGGTIFRRALKQKSCLPGSVDTDLLLEPLRGDIVLEKHTYGLTSEHIRRLRRRKIECVTVCGLDTDACVLGVMFSLFDAQLECHLKEDLCWSSSGLHKPALAIIRAQFPAGR